jgi:hypothetical protein
MNAHLHTEAIALKVSTYLAFTVARDAYNEINPKQASDGDEWDTAMTNAKDALDKAEDAWSDAREALCPLSWADASRLGPQPKPVDRVEEANAMQDVTYLAFTVANDAHSEIKTKQERDGGEWDTAVVEAKAALDKAYDAWSDAREALNVANGLR